MPDKITVELYYDVLSPYSWFGFETLIRYRSKWRKMDLKLKPFSLAGIMKSAGNQPPGVNPIKMQYIAKDLMRLAAHHKVPMQLPKNAEDVIFKKGSKSAQLFLTAIDMENPEYTEELSRQLWMRVWSRDEGITENSDFEKAAKAAKISDAIIKKALTKANEKATEDRLNSITEEAIKCGAFGAPTIVIDVDGKKEMVFGSDRFDIVADLIGEKFEGSLPDLAKR